MFRLIAVVTVVSTFGISAYYRYHARLTAGTIPRSSEPLGLIAGRALVAIPLFGSLLTYLIHPRWVAWAQIPLATWAHWLGAGLAILAVPFALWVFRSIGSNVSETVLTKPGQTLVTTGPYHWIRHPLYAAGGLLLLGVGLMAANWLILSLASLALILIRLVVIPKEEAALVERFGPQYLAYKSSTGPLLPRVGRLF
jgi:protein-S-isoprenylcysteine O-methyltransferase Ste14